MTKRLPLLRVMVTAHVSFAVLVWLAITVVTAAVTAGIATWGEIDRSIWHFVATQLGPFLALGLGMDAITTYLRLHIAHGRTRKDYLRQLFPHLAVTAVSLALLAVIGYLVEHGVYAMLDWPHRLAEADPPLSITSVLDQFGPHAARMLLWTIMGAMLTAAFTRNAVLGVCTIPIGLLLIAASEPLVDGEGVSLFRNVMESLRLPIVAGLGFGAAVVAVGCAAIWGTVRDMPVRPKVT